MTPLSPDTLDRIFVYGTLREGFANHGRDVLTAHARRLGDGTVPGRLVDLGSFPALVEPVEATDRVQGEVYEIEHEPLVALDRLDRYEGARGPDPLPYERRRLEVRMADGSNLEAWTYVWTEDASQHPRVPGGDWVAYAASSPDVDEQASPDGGNPTP